MTELLTINWISFLLHMLALTLLLLAFVMPYWYAHEDGANDFQHGGLWRRCRLGGDCLPLKDASEDLAIHMTPTQVMVTIAFVSAVASTVFYALWLWKGEMCDTPWKKRCTWCAETYVRSRTPKTEENAIYRKLKWAAFGFSMVAGVFCLIGTIVFMVNTLLNNEVDTDQLSWCSWLALTAGTLFVISNIAIGLCTYLLRFPDTSEIDEEVMESKLGEYDVQGQREEERVKAWIMEQDGEGGLDNPSFSSRLYDSRGRMNSTAYSTRSHLSNHLKNSGIFYIGQNDAPSDLGGSLKSIYSREGFEQRYGPKKRDYLAAGAAGPLYDNIFRGKIPMIPKQPMTPEMHMIYSTIYGYVGGNTLPPQLRDHFGKRVDPEEIKDRIKRPSSSLGITAEYGGDYSYDLAERRGYPIYDMAGRPMSDSELHIKGRHDKGRPLGQLSDDYDNTYQSFDFQPAAGPFEPGEIPEARRRRKHPNRKSTSSLATSTSSKDPDTTLSKIRSKYPDDIDDSMEIPLSQLLSHGIKTPPVKDDNFEVEDIWVLQNKDDIGGVLGKSRVHFKLEQSIQELDEYDQIIEEEVQSEREAEV